MAPTIATTLSILITDTAVRWGIERFYPRKTEREAAVEHREKIVTIRERRLDIREHTLDRRECSLDIQKTVLEVQQKILRARYSNEEKPRAGDAIKEL